MKVINELIDYLYSRGLLSSKEIGHLKDHGYVREYYDSHQDDSPNKSHLKDAAPDVDNAGDEAVYPAGRVKKNAGRPGSSGKPRQTQGRDINKLLDPVIPLWEKELSGMIKLAEHIKGSVCEFKNAPKIIVPAGDDSLDQIITDSLKSGSPGLREIWDSICFDAYIDVTKGLKGPRITQYNTMLSGIKTSGTGPFSSILRHKNIAFVCTLAQAQVKIGRCFARLVKNDINLISESLRRNYHPAAHVALNRLVSAEDRENADPSQHGMLMYGFKHQKPCYIVKSEYIISPKCNTGCSIVVCDIIKGDFDEIENCFYDGQSGEKLIYLPDDIKTIHSVKHQKISIRQWKVSNDYSMYAVLYADKFIELFDIKSGRLLYSFNDSTGISSIEYFTFSIDNRHIMITGTNITDGISMPVFIIFNIDEKRLNLLKNHEAYDLEFLVSPDNSLAAIRVEDQIFILNIITDELIAEIDYSSYYSKNLFSDESDLLFRLFFSVDNQLFVFPVQPKRRVMRSWILMWSENVPNLTIDDICGSDDSWKKIFFIEGSQLVFMEMLSGDIMLFDTDTSSFRIIYHSLSGYISHIEVSRDNATAVIVDHRCYLILLDLNTDQVLYQTRSKVQEINSAFIDNSKLKLITVHPIPYNPMVIIRDISAGYIISEKIRDIVIKLFLKGHFDTIESMPPRILKTYFSGTDPEVLITHVSFENENNKFIARYETKFEYEYDRFYIPWNISLSQSDIAMGIYHSLVLSGTGNIPAALESMGEVILFKYEL